MSQHDFIIDDAIGLPVRLDLQAALQALATCSSGATAPATTYAGMLWLDTSVLPDGALKQRNLANSAWLTLPLGVPTKASSAEVIAGTDDAKFATALGIATRDAAAAKLARNRVVNGAIQISQENGDTAGTISPYYPADTWFASFIGGAHSIQRVTSVTPRGSQKRIRWTVTTAKAVLAAGDYAGMVTRLEGWTIADFGFGQASARQVIVRFGFRAPAGTYSMAFKNQAANRSYVANFTISAGQANTDTEQTFVIPGDITGTWTIDALCGLQISIVWACGTTYQMAPNVWGAGNMLGSPATTNGIATVGLVYEMFDVGLYIDINATGIAPLWEMPDEATELLACQRYYVNHIFLCYNAYMNITQGAFAMAYMPASMRTIAPTIAGVNISASAFPAAVGTGAVSFTGARELRETRTSNATLATASFITEWSASARL